mgnify:CR=1 FL=1
MAASAISSSDGVRPAQRFLKKQGRGKKEKSRPAAPWEFCTSSGLRVLAGRATAASSGVTFTVRQVV